MKFFYLILLVVVVLAAQNALLPALGTEVINVPLLALTTILFLWDYERVIAAILMMGLFNDFWGNNFFGFYLIAFGLTGLILFFFQEKILIKRNMVVFLLNNMAAVIIWWTIIGGLALAENRWQALGSAAGMEDYFFWAMKQVGGNLAGALLIYNFFPELQRKLTRDILG